MAQHSPLLKLPPELRNNIWWFSVVDKDDIDVGLNDPLEPAVLATCKQIREEAVEMYYGANKFYYLIARPWYRDPEKITVIWLKTLGAPGRCRLGDLIVGTQLDCTEIPSSDTTDALALFYNMLGVSEEEVPFCMWSGPLAALRSDTIRFPKVKARRTTKPRQAKSK